MEKMDKLLAILLSLSLFLAMASTLVMSATVAGTVPFEDSTSTYGSNSTVDDESATSTQTNAKRSRTSTQIPLPNRTYNFTSARNAGAVHLGWPTVSSRTNVHFATAIEAFLVQSNPSEGDTITLSCIVYDPNILTVSWYNNKRLSTHDILAPAADVQRMSISHDTTDDTRRVFNLTIEYLHSDDNGEYTCRGINRPDSEETVSLTVRYVPELHYPECYLNGKRQAIVMEGDDLRFKCQSEKGIPPWHLIWFRQHNGSIAVISTSVQDRSELITSEHSVVASRALNGATFMCSLVCLSAECLRSNSNGPRNCNIGPLIVRPRPPTESPPIITIDPGKQIASEGDDIEISCSTSLADGNAVWFPVDGEPPADDHIKVSDDGSQMAIMNLKESDTDLMACGVFCQEKLVTVGQVNMKVLRKNEPTTTAETTTTTSTTTSPTIQTSHLTTDLKQFGKNNSRSKNSDSSESSVFLGAPLGIIFLLGLLLIFLFIVVKSRRNSYQRAATKEPPDIIIPI